MVKNPWSDYNYEDFTEESEPKKESKGLVYHPVQERMKVEADLWQRWLDRKKQSVLAVKKRERAEQKHNMPPTLHTRISKEAYRPRMVLKKPL